MNKKIAFALLTTSILAGASVKPAFAAPAPCTTSAGSVSVPSAGATITCASGNNYTTINIADGVDNVIINTNGTTTYTNINTSANSGNFEFTDSAFEEDGPSGNRINLTNANSNNITFNSTNATSSYFSSSTLKIGDTSQNNSIYINGDSLITAHADSTRAISLDNAESNTIDINDTSIVSNTGSENAAAILLINSESTLITLNSDASIATSGANDSNAIALRSEASNNIITANDDSIIQTTGDDSDAVLIYDRSDYNTITLNDYAHIETSGSNSSGLTITQYVGLATTESENNTVNLNDDSSITTTGDYSSGIKIAGANLNYINMYGGTISTSGLSATGIKLDNADNNTINIDGGTVSSTGDESEAILVDGSIGNTIILTGTGSVYATGNISNGIHIVDDGTAGENTITLEENAIIEATDAAIKLSSDTITSGTVANITLSENATLEGGNYGILASNNSAQEINITLNSGTGADDLVSITGANNGAIILGNSSDTLTINNNVDISGTVDVGDDDNIGTDTLNLNSATLSIDGNLQGFEVFNATGTSTVSGSGDIAGGSTTDVFNLSSATVTLEEGIVLSGFETINVTGTSVFNGELDASGRDINLASGANFHFNGTFTNSTVTVGNGATFGGNNDFNGDLLIENGGTLAPGNSIGTINVVGDLDFASGSNFDVEVDGATTDVVNVTGNVVIDNGAVLNVLPLGAQYSGSNPFLTATGTITGTWSIVNFNGQATSVLYVPTSPASATLVANVVVANPSLANAVAFTTVQNSQIFTDAIAEHAAENAFEKGKKFWTKAIYKNSNRESNATYAGFVNNVEGVVLGYESEVNDNFKAGVSIATLNNDTNVKQGVGETSGQAGLVGIYGTYTKPKIANGLDLFTNAALTTGYHNINNERNVVNGSVASTAKSDSEAYESSILLQAGLKKAISEKWNVVPKVSAQYFNVSGTGDTETGGGLSNISVDDYTISTFKTTEGISLVSETGYSIKDSVTVKPNFEVSLSQEFSASDRSYNGAFSNATAFTLQTDESDSTFANIGLGADFIFNQTTTGNISYIHSFGDNESRDYARIGFDKKL